MNVVLRARRACFESIDGRGHRIDRGVQFEELAPDLWVVSTGQGEGAIAILQARVNTSPFGQLVVESFGLLGIGRRSEAQSQGIFGDALAEHSLTSREID